MEGQLAPDGGLRASGDDGPDVAVATGDASKTGCLGSFRQLSWSLPHLGLRELGI